MCIVADDVNDVSKTKIGTFHVGYSLKKGDIIPAQLVVYSANVDSLAKTNAFILPVHNPGNDPSKIIPLDFSDLSDFFVQLDFIYDKWFPKRSTMKNSFNDSRSFCLSNDSMLEVHRVGDYKFSIVPTKRDMHRINTSQLSISPTANDAVNVHSDDYSFIVYQFFEKGKLDIAPFAYLCSSYNEKSFIIPTIHGHPHSSGYSNYAPINGSNSFDNSAEYDHTIYSFIKSEGNSNVNSGDVKKIHRLFKKVLTDYQNRSIRIFCPSNFIPGKIEIKNYARNRNIFINESGHSFINDLVIDVKG